MIPKDKLKDLVTKLKAEHEATELHLVTGAGEQVLVRGPKPPEYQRFQDEAGDGKKGKALRNLALACIVHPAGDELEALLERKPGIVSTIGSELLTIAGVDDEVESKKL